MIRLLGALALTGSLFAHAAAAQVSPVAVVLASTAPDYAIGQLLTGNRVRIPDGASVSFLLPTGQIVTKQGAFEGLIAAEARSGPSLADVLSPGTDRSDLGGTRSARTSGPLQRPAIDLAVGDTLCLLPGAEPVLTLPSSPAFREVELIREDSGKHARVTWGEGEQSRAWPREVPLTAGHVTAVAIRNGAQRRFEIKPINVADDTAVQAAAFAFAGCERQAAFLLERVREQAVPLDIHIATDRGREPSYRTGEPIELVVRTSRDAFVYCVMRDARGQVIPLFPPNPSEAKLSARDQLTLPGRSYDLRADTQLSGSTVSCLASRTDLGRSLAELAADGKPKPLSSAAVAAFERAAANRVPGEVDTAQLNLKVRR